MNIKQRQIAQTTYDGNSVGRIFRKGSFWDKLFKGATAIATVLFPPLGAGMALIDRNTPERPELPGGGGSSGGGSGDSRGSGGRGGDREFIAGTNNQNKKNYNTPKVF